MPEPILEISFHYNLHIMDFLIPKVYAAVGAESSAGSTGSVAFNHLLQNILTNIVHPIIYLIMASALIYFLWGVVVFIQNADNADKREDGYKHMIWGIVGLFIMLSASGIINIIASTIGL